MWSTSVVALLVAALGGAAVGVERQWSGHASGPNARFAGVRTFTMLGAFAGLAGRLWTWGATWPAVALLGTAGALVVSAYARASARDVDGTTEVGALVVLAAGTAAGLGEVEIASGVIAVTVVLLVEKSRLHAMVERLEDTGIAAAARFAVMAMVVLPLLPEGPFGPLGGIRPRELWMLVLFFSGLSFAGYLARALVGERRGYAIAGLLGGLVSSTQVTLSFARLSRTHVSLSVPLAQGAVAANAVLFARVAVATAVLNPAVAARLPAYFAAPFAIGLLVAATGLRRPRGHERPLEPSPNPLQLLSALQMAVAFQVVLMVVHTARTWFETTGLLATAAALGATDVDALTMSMARSASNGQMPADIAALAIATGIASNTVVKLAIALAIGRGRFRMITAGALGTIGVLLILALVWLT